MISEDHVTLKTGEMMLESCDQSFYSFDHRNKLQFNIYFIFTVLLIK